MPTLSNVALSTTVFLAQAEGVGRENWAMQTQSNSSAAVCEVKLLIANTLTGKHGSDKSKVDADSHIRLVLFWE